MDRRRSGLGLSKFLTGCKIRIPKAFVEIERIKELSSSSRGGRMTSSRPAIRQRDGGANLSEEGTLPGTSEDIRPDH